MRPTSASNRAWLFDVEAERRAVVRAAIAQALGAPSSFLALYLARCRPRWWRRR
jgi:hypothetical protein